ncbi:hypothetical protein RRF57_005577 [Xylaria bambusicola]|uniref:Uncharacterized protein n=1 Tax=Xylaria bambusicola TaxID=326684 RepID=A0AAN7UK23_9PEZI
MANSRAAAPVNVDIGVAVSMNVEKLSGSEDEKEMRQHVMKSNQFIPEPAPPSSHDSSSNGERLHRLHPAHARKLSESRAQSTDRNYYPPPARSTYFSAPRSTGRRADSLDMSTSSGLAPSGKVYGHTPSSAASSVTSIGMAISTAPTSADSTPPPSTTEGLVALGSQSLQSLASDETASATHSRKALFGGFRRGSSDTIRLSSNEPSERSQSQAPSTRGRRLSKSRPRQSSDNERSASANKVPVAPVSFTKPTRAQTESVVYQLNQLESTSPYHIYDPHTTSKPPRSRGRRLSKDRPPSSYIQNGDANTKPRWSFFGRRNSITAA